MAIKKPAGKGVSRTRAETAEALTGIRDVENAREPSDAKTEAQKAQQRAAILGGTAAFTRESVVKSVSDLTLLVSKQLASLQETLLGRVQERDDLLEAIDLLTKDLEALHGKDIVASSIADLISIHNARTIEFDNLERDRQEAVRKNVEAQREAWKAEQAATALARQREIEQYEYNKNVERRNAEDAFQIKMRDLARENALKQTALEASWAAREEVLKKAEQELVNLRAQVASHEDLTAKAVDKAVAIATGSVKRDLEHKFEITKKDLETQITICRADEMRAKTLAESQQAVIQNLQTQLTSAQARMSDMAAKALESSSGREALQRVQETLSTQQAPKK